MDNTKLAKEYLHKAIEQQIEGNLEEAIKYCKLSLCCNDSSEAHTHLGWIYSMNGEYEDAIDECLSAIKLDKEFGNPYNDIGSYLIMLNREEESINWFRRAVKAPRFKQRYLAYSNLAEIYKNLHEWEKARKMFKKALHDNPQYRPAKTGYYKIVALSN